MRTMKKTTAVFLAALLLLTACAFTGCDLSRNGNGEFSVVVTIFPEYDWVRQILGDEANRFDLTLLLDSGSDLHNYQPTADDIVTVASCDLFLYVGGHSDEWVADVLAQSKNDDMVVINLIEVLGDAVKEEETVDGMEPEDDHDHDHEEPEVDEHVWLSLKNAVAACEAIRDGLCRLDPDHAQTYGANTDAYVAKLNALDAQYAAAVDGASVKTLLFGDRFPFRYLTDDYGLDYYAAFAGCSAESDASFETIVFLAEKMDALSLRHIIKLEGSSADIADTIIRNTAAKNATVLSLNSMQTITQKDVQNGADYLEIMTENLNVLKQALQ